MITYEIEFVNKFKENEKMLLTESHHYDSIYDYANHVAESNLGKLIRISEINYQVIKSSINHNEVFAEYDTYRKALNCCELYNYMMFDENDFCWDLSIKEKQRQIWPPVKKHKKEIGR